MHHELGCQRLDSSDFKNLSCQCGRVDSDCSEAGVEKNHCNHQLLDFI